MSETVQLIASHDIGGYRPYPAYKASGVEWLGEVPEGWEVRRLKTIAEVNLSNVDKKSAEGQDMVLLCNYTDVYYNEHITNQIDFMRATATPEQIKRFSLKEGDVLITKDSESWDDIAVPAVVSEDLDNVLCGYHLAMIRPTKQTDGRFLARAFSAVGPKDQFHIKANGITRFGLGGDAIRTGLFALPPLPEQHAIAAFLDHKTAEIDALIAAKERLIALLREKRAALITSAVTKGLDPDVAMKDSGVEWLGEVPAHWEGTSLKRWVATKITDGPHETPEFLDEGVPFVSAEAVTNGRIDFNKKRGYISEELHRIYSRKCKPIRDDILLCKSGATTGKFAIVEVDFEFSVWSPLALIRPIHTLILPRFLSLILEADYVQNQIRQTWSAGTQPNISMGDLELLYIVVPPIEEQKAILEQLKTAMPEFDMLFSKVQEAIDRLKEYRTALISAAVTGKIDVREGA